MPFKASFCDPLNPAAIDLGEIDKCKIIEVFENIPWSELLRKMETARESDIHYSPSFEVTNTANRCGLNASIINETEWHIFYRRPELRRLLFGLSDYRITEKRGQTLDDVRECLAALIDNNLEILEGKIR
jgi:hypothetical protein